MRGTTVDHGQFSPALPHHFSGHREDAGAIFDQGAFLWWICFHGLTIAARAETFLSYATFSSGANRILARVADIALKSAMSDLRRFHIRSAAARAAAMQVPGSETGVISWPKALSSVSMLGELTVGEKGLP
jgi:hypothetical protein